MASNTWIILIVVGLFLILFAPFLGTLLIPVLFIIGILLIIWAIATKVNTPKFQTGA